MTPAARPLAGRVVLILGAGSHAGREVARHLAALGAGIVAADPSVQHAATTAGYIAASGGTARVVEDSAPPLGGEDLVRRCEAVLARPTDVFVAEEAFDSRAAAKEAATALDAALSTARVLVLPAHPEGGAKALARRIADAWTGAAG